MMKYDSYGITEFLQEYPWMSISPSTRGNIVIKGKFEFNAIMEDGPIIQDNYIIEISIPGNYPRDLPKVKELKGKILDDGEHHVNPDETLCLGSPVRLLKKINKNPKLINFAEACLIPYLYAMSHKLNGGPFIFGELAHGRRGVLQDYKELLQLSTDDQILEALKLLGMKKRLANKKPCPCGCGNRLGKCSFHHLLNEYRKYASASWYKYHLRQLVTRS